MLVQNLEQPTKIVEITSCGESYIVLKSARWSLAALFIACFGYGFKLLCDGFELAGAFQSDYDSFSGSEN